MEKPNNTRILIKASVTLEKQGKTVYTGKPVYVRESEAQLNAAVLEPIERSPGLHDRRGVRLTAREVEVLGLIAKGLSSQEAADELFVSKRTIDFHLANIYDKLQVNNRVQAIRAASRLGLFPFHP